MKGVTPLERSLLQATKEYNEINETSLTPEEVKGVFYTYYRLVAKILGKGNKDDYKSYIRRVESPGMGFFKFRLKKYVRRLEPRLGVTDIDFAKRAFAAIKKRGWRYYTWTEDEGFIFINEGTGQRYHIKRKGIVDMINASAYLYTIMDEELFKSGYDVYLGENIGPVEVKTGTIVIYNKQGKLVKRFKNLEEASNSTYFSTSYIHSVLLNNWDNDKPARIRDGYWFYDSGDGDTKKFRAYNINITNHTIYDVLNAKTGEVVVERLGTLSDICEYILALGLSIRCKTGRLKNIADGDGRKQLYGFRFRQSAIQSSKY